MTIGRKVQSALSLCSVIFTEKGNDLPDTGVKGALSDGGLVAAIRAGDQSAMAALYDRYSGIVYAVALRVLGDSAAAEDILQEVFLSFWRRSEAFDAHRGNLGPWLTVVTRNRAIDRLRKQRPETDIEGVVLLTDHDWAQESDRARLLERVRRTLSGLPAAQKSALEMAYFEGLSHTEIAAKTGEPLGTIKARIRTGLAALRKAFAT